jgi:hypothetical protein
MEIKLKRINYDSKEEIEQFINKRAEVVPVAGNYHYSACYYYNQLIANTKHQYGILELNSDKLLVIINRVQFMRTDYYRLIDFPISLKGSAENEIEAFDILFNDLVIEQAYVSDIMLDRIDNSKYKVEEIVDSDFFVDIDNDTFLYRKRYMHHYKILHVINDKNFAIVKAERIHKEDILKLYDTWTTYKIAQGIFSKKLFKNYLGDYNQNVFLDKLLQYVLLYKNQVVALVVFIPTLEGYCQKILEWAYRGKDIEDERLKWIFTCSGEIIHFLSLHELKKEGIKYMSCAGGAGSLNLYNHKKNTCPHRIDYYKVRQK